MNAPNLVGSFAAPVSPLPPSPRGGIRFDEKTLQEQVMLSRRVFVAGCAGFVSPWYSAQAAAVLTEDGIYKQEWFLESLLELSTDLNGATKSEKRFAIMWELRGCPYCRQTHLVNFAKPEIENFVKAHFEILQLNIVGLREVTDFDGERLSEKSMAAKYGVRATPTIQFFPDLTDGLAQKWPEDREVARSQGYLEPSPFLAMFRFVFERAYQHKTLSDYLKANG
jgi:thioredoxin-related protein